MERDRPADTADETAGNIKTDTRRWSSSSIESGSHDPGGHPLATLERGRSYRGAGCPSGGHPLEREADEFARTRFESKSKAKVTAESFDIDAAQSSDWRSVRHPLSEFNRHSSGSHALDAAAYSEDIDQITGGGNALPTTVRAQFGFPDEDLLRSVRIHTSDEAAQLADGLGARAFTHGRHVVFGANEYNPWTTSGRKLLAHELSHVLQWRAGRFAGEAMARVNSHGSSSQPPKHSWWKCLRAYWTVHSHPKAKILKQIGYSRSAIGRLVADCDTNEARQRTLTREIKRHNVEQYRNFLQEDQTRYEHLLNAIEYYLQQGIEPAVIPILPVGLNIKLTNSNQPKYTQSISAIVDSGAGTMNDDVDVVIDRPTGYQIGLNASTAIDSITFENWGKTFTMSIHEGWMKFTSRHEGNVLIGVAETDHFSPIITNRFIRGKLIGQNAGIALQFSEDGHQLPLPAGASQKNVLPGENSTLPVTVRPRTVTIPNLQEQGPHSSPGATSGTGSNQSAIFDLLVDTGAHNTILTNSAAREAGITSIDFRGDEGEHVVHQLYVLETLDKACESIHGTNFSTVSKETVEQYVHLLRGHFSDTSTDDNPDLDIPIDRVELTTKLLEYYELKNLTSYIGMYQTFSREGGYFSGRFLQPKFPASIIIKGETYAIDIRILKDSEGDTYKGALGDNLLEHFLVGLDKHTISF